MLLTQTFINAFIDDDEYEPVAQIICVVLDDNTSHFDPAINTDINDESVLVILNSNKVFYYFYYKIISRIIIYSSYGKLVPVMVTRVPPPVPPLCGDDAVIVGVDA